MRMMGCDLSHPFLFYENKVYVSEIILFFLEITHRILYSIKGLVSFKMY